MGRKKIENIAREIGEKAKPKKSATINQQGKGNIAVVGDNNTVYADRVSQKELRVLNGRLKEWAELEQEAGGIDIGKARKKVYGMFNRKFGLTSYKELPASKLKEAYSFIEGQVKKLENKLLRMGIEGTPKHKLILRIHRVRSFLPHLKEEEFVNILLNKFGEIDLSKLTVKELQSLLDILSKMR